MKKSKNIENPFIIFKEWFNEAQKLDIKYKNAANLATCTKFGIPSNRMVLLKDYDKNGFVFYTNFDSRKGSELKENPYAALCFYWMEINKQIRIEGIVKKISDKESDKYFNSRTFLSKISATISKQSQEMDNNIDLIKEINKISIKSLNIKRPEYWGGFRIEPTEFEFWTEGKSRIHNRKLFYLDNGKWKIKFLYP